MGPARIKKAFILIELAVSLSLASSLLFFVYAMTTHLISARRSLERAFLTVHSRLLIQERLSALLASLEPGTLSVSQPHTLTFKTSNQLDSDPAYSGSQAVHFFVKDDALLLLLKDRPEILAEKICALKVELIAHPGPLASLRLSITPTHGSPFQCAFCIHDTVQE